MMSERTFGAMLATIIFLPVVIATGAIASQKASSRHIIADRDTKLPSTVPSAFGTVQVTTAPVLVDEDDTPLYGRAHLPQLHIQIREGMAPGFAQYVLDHEICHIALLETPMPDDGTEEAVCDAIARQRASERR